MRAWNLPKGAIRSRDLEGHTIQWSSEKGQKDKNIMQKTNN